MSDDRRSRPCQTRWQPFFSSPSPALATADRAIPVASESSHASIRKLPLPRHLRVSSSRSPLASRASSALSSRVLSPSSEVYLEDAARARLFAQVPSVETRTSAPACLCCPDSASRVGKDHVQFPWGLPRVLRREEVAGSAGVGSGGWRVSETRQRDGRFSEGPGFSAYSCLYGRESNHASTPGRAWRRRSTVRMTHLRRTSSLTS